MYPNYIEDRKDLGYKALVDINCGRSLVLITNSTTLFVKNVSSNGKRQIIVIIGAIIIIFSPVPPAKAIGMNPFPDQTVVSILHLDIRDISTTRLIEPIKVTDIEPKVMMPRLIRSIRITTKSDLQNSQWLKEFVSIIRGGEDKKLIKSIISKVSETDLDIPSLNKILKK